MSSILLFIFYSFLGFFMMAGAFTTLGLMISAVIALAKIAYRPRLNILLLGLYVVLGVICALLVWSGFFVAGWIGDRTANAAQEGLIAGAVFPGLLTLKMLPGMVVNAIKQTSGIDTSGLPPQQGGLFDND